MLEYRPYDDKAIATSYRTRVLFGNEALLFSRPNRQLLLSRPYCRRSDILVRRSWLSSLEGTIISREIYSRFGPLLGIFDGRGFDTCVVDEAHSMRSKQ